jgi:hypothetical protein
MMENIMKEKGIQQEYDWTKRSREEQICQLYTRFFGRPENFFAAEKTSAPAFLPVLDHKETNWLNQYQW